MKTVIEDSRSETRIDNLENLKTRSHINLQESINIENPKVERENLENTKTRSKINLKKTTSIKNSNSETKVENLEHLKTRSHINLQEPIKTEDSDNETKVEDLDNLKAKSQIPLQESNSSPPTTPIRLIINHNNSTEPNTPIEKLETIKTRSFLRMKSPTQIHPTVMKINEDFKSKTPTIPEENETLNDNSVYQPLLTNRDKNNDMSSIPSSNLNKTETKNKSNCQII